MNAWETQVVQVHEELLEVTRKLHRERRRYSLRVMEKECDARETESLRGIVEAKTASLEALKSLQARADAKRDAQKRVAQEDCAAGRGMSTESGCPGGS
eukprot:jgi/Picre1/29251/NNA_004643.t1